LFIHFRVPFRESLPMRLYILALSALTLVGCVTPQELAREDHDRCTGYGFQPGSETYAQWITFFPQTPAHRGP
jgi:hypothetical protein